LTVGGCALAAGREQPGIDGIAQRGADDRVDIADGAGGQARARLVVGPAVLLQRPVERVEPDSGRPASGTGAM
jgi:hypothetical protein